VEAHKESQEVYSKKVKAGKRTYFFDVKATRANDYYLTITESKKQYDDEGSRYEKHKIFLYKEDLNKFLEALQSTADHIKKELLPHYDFDKFKDYRSEDNGLAKRNHEEAED
jgi:hypothetical protein